MSLFGQSSAGSLFGQNANAQQQQKPAGTSLFGQPQQTQQSGGGLFGQSTTQQNQQNTAQQQPSTGTGLFGQQNTNTQTQQNTGGGLGMGSSLFGQQNQPAQQGATSGLGSGLFGQPAQGGSLFGGQQQQQQPAQQQQQRPSLFSLGGSTLGGGSAGMSTTNQPGLGASGLPQINPVQNTQAQAQPAQPAGAYFDSLLAKSQKAGDTKMSVDDLPSLELGLGDLRHRLKKLQSKPSEKPLDGKAHYLLAGSGVDPGAAAKDLGLIDAQGGRADRTTHTGYAPSEMDVETYLSNLQTKTTLSMIADGLERSVRDFDNFLEDTVSMEWEAQRKRIYQHFGIKPQEEPGRESQGAFGRSKRGKTQAGMSKAGRSSMLGKSMYKSIIGAPTHIGAHQPGFSDVERTGAEEASRTVSDRLLRERQSRLAEKIRELNVARLTEQPYPIITQLAEAEKKTNEPHSFHIQEGYYALKEIVGEDPDAETTLDHETASEREYAANYLDENPNSQRSMDMRNKILSGSLHFLELQFMREVESLIAKHPHEAKLGGLPDIRSKIKAYIRLRAARKDLAPEGAQIAEVSGEYAWAMVFYLLRSGHVEEAARYVNDYSTTFKTLDRAFPTYMNNYASTEDRRIQSRKLLDRCTSEYVGRVGDSSVDPYRQACYKIIGRADLSNRSLDGLNTDINDWIWLQFNLAREGDKSVEMAGESYGLAELQASIREIGAKHFPKTPTEDSNGSFGMFFYLQVLAGLFEDAIAYLYPFSYVDAVHFAVALEYYGLLRAGDALAESNDLRTYSTKNLPQISFGRMLGYYTRDFRAADVVSAVDYLALICLNKDLGGEAGRRHSALCHEALRELVLETREFSVLIGDIRPDGRRIKGIIEERGPLMDLGTEDNFVNTVTMQAASFAEENGRTTDSVLLYHLAGEYDMVISIVSRALSEAIALDIGEDPIRLMPVKPRAATDKEKPVPGSSLSLAAIDDPIELARTMMSMYERDAMFHRPISDHNKIACRILLEMSNIKILVEGGKWAQCLDVS
jgi:nuclear pore complex protein Nup93